MKLNIHFGIYKAGSSYLQYLCANSRRFLDQQGYYFPYSKADQRMLKGEISPGNADDLGEALKSTNLKKCQGILRKWHKDSKQKGCKAVLISSEALVHQFAQKDRLTLLIEAAQLVGYQEIHAMGFFRDLADHAISTYKHRAKSGKIPNFDHWLNQVYETPELLKNLAQIRKEEDRLYWTFRKFTKNSEALEKAFFEDWLQIAKPPFVGVPTVNESVSLSEVLVMQEVRRFYPEVTDVFVKNLKRIPKDLKANNRSLELWYRNKAINAFKNKNISLDSINQFLEENEGLKIGKLAVENEDFNDQNGIHLSAKQIQCIVEVLAYLKSFEGWMLILRRKVKNLFPLFILRGIMKMKR